MAQRNTSIRDNRSSGRRQSSTRLTGSGQQSGQSVPRTLRNQEDERILLSEQLGNLDVQDSSANATPPLRQPRDYVTSPPTRWGYPQGVTGVIDSSRQPQGYNTSRNLGNYSQERNDAAEHPQPLNDAASVLNQGNSGYLSNTTIGGNNGQYPANQNMSWPSAFPQASANSPGPKWGYGNPPQIASYDRHESTNAFGNGGYQHQDFTRQEQLGSPVLYSNNYLRNERPPNVINPQPSFNTGQNNVVKDEYDSPSNNEEGSPENDEHYDNTTRDARRESQEVFSNQEYQNEEHSNQGQPSEGYQNQNYTYGGYSKIQAGQPPEFHIDKTEELPHNSNPKEPRKRTKSQTKPSGSFWGPRQPKNNPPSTNPDAKRQTKGDNKSELNSRYEIHDSKSFRPGSVLSVLWSEPSGGGGVPEQGFDSESVETLSKFGERAYHSIRRMVVVRNYKGHALCIPILTYRGQGTLKSGCKAEDHTIIYSEGQNALALNGEQSFKKPIRVVMYDKREVMKYTSRLNYAKVYTVEHNLKVRFIGKIHKNYEGIFKSDYQLTHNP